SSIRGLLAPDPLTLTRCARSPLSAARYGWQERHFVTIAEQRRQPRVFLVDRARDASAVILHRGELCDQRVPRVVRRRALRQLPRQLRRAGQLAQPREQADVYVHARSSAAARAVSSAGSAVAPSIQTSPPSKCSCFQIGAICFTRSIA